MNRVILTLVFLLTVAATLASQDKSYYDVIELKNGLSLRGLIVSYDQDQTITFQLFKGDQILLKQDEIQKVSHVNLGKIPKPYAFKESGLYHATLVSISLSNQRGYSITHAIGHKLNKRLALGLGTGLEDYENGNGKRIIPLFAEVRGYLWSKKVTPYYSLRTGYGIALKNQDFSITDTQGGLLVNPEIGYRLGGSELVNVIIGIGLKYQKAQFTYRWGDTINEQNITYKRYFLSLGIVF